MFWMDEVFVLIGIIVVWALKGRKYSLKKEMNDFRCGEFLFRKEGVIGLAATLVFIGLIMGLIWVAAHFLGQSK